MSGIGFTAYVRVRNVLLAERKMREYVFRAESRKRERKVQEIDDALAAVEILRKQAGVCTEDEMQRSLIPSFTELSGKEE